jgi:hypothetical protein
LAESSGLLALKRSVKKERTLIMSDRVRRLRWKGFLCVALIVGCSEPAEQKLLNDDAPVRAKFAELQSAIKARDADKLWSLLDSKSRADAERAAKAIQAAYAKATDDEKTKQEKALGLAGKALAGLTGKGYLKTNRFHSKYHEVPDSSIERVVVEGETATVYYLEDDGDKEKIILVRQDGEWKVWLTMPKAGQPVVGK